MKKTIYLLVLLFSVMITSCDMLFMDNEASNDGVVNFESMWKQIDEKYSFFEYKNINWDSVYNVYRPMVNSNTDGQELFNVLAGMMNALNDGHSNIFSPFDYSRNWSWYLDYPANFDQNILDRNYLGNDYSVTGPFKHKWLDKENRIAYIYYGSFSGSLITQEQWDIIENKYVNCKGVVFDVRNNGGGYMSNVNFLGSQFVDEIYFGNSLNYGFYKVKNGPAHDDFSEEILLSVSPSEREYETNNHIVSAVGLRDKNIIILTNRHCYSATNFFVMLMKSLPNVTVVGDFTGGGGGLPMDYQLPNGWNYRFSSTITYDNSGFNIEHGIAPDIKIDMSQNDILNGKDSLIEKALSILNKNSK